MAKLKTHPAADIFPMLTGANYEALKADIAENGMHEAIQLWEGRIIDGRNRYRAALELGIEVTPVEVSDRLPGLDPFSYAMSRNYHRRHLEPHERGGIAKEYAKRRGMVKGKAGRPSKKSRQPDAISQRQVAKELGVSEPMLRRDLKAAEAFEALPEPLKEKVAAKEMKLPEAVREAKKNVQPPEEVDIQPPKKRLLRDDEVRAMMRRIEEITDAIRDRHQDVGQLVMLYVRLRDIALNIEQSAKL